VGASSGSRISVNFEVMVTAGVGTLDYFDTSSGRSKERYNNAWTRLDGRLMIRKKKSTGRR